MGEVDSLTNVIRDKSDVSLERAVQENWLGLCQRLARHTEGWTVYDDGRVWWRESLFLSPDFNSVHRTTCTDANMDEVIKQVLRHREQTGKPVAWTVWPADSPVNLADRLVHYGLKKQDFALPSMACDLTTLADDTENERIPTLKVKKVETKEAFVDSFVPVLLEGFGVIEEGTAIQAKIPDAWEPFVTAYVSSSFVDQPTIHHYLGIVDGTPAVTGTLVYEAGVAGLYIIATKPSFRRKGFGRELTLALMEQAKADGYEIAVLRSSPMGYSVYQSLGFHLCGESTTYMLPDS